MKFLGQENNKTTFNLARMNMILHGKKFNIQHGNTLSNDKFEGEKFDTIVSNPPYSTHWDRDGLKSDIRFSDVGALAPKTKSDFAFILHSLHHLENDGRAVIVCYPGILYRTGAEQKIRKYLVDKNVIDTVIALPPNTFLNTAIAVNILVLSKCKSNNKTLFVNAENLVTKSGKKNKLSENNINKIVSIFQNRTEEKYISKLATDMEIIENSCNLSVSNYVDYQREDDELDIKQINREIRIEHAKLNRALEELEKLCAEIDGGEL